MSENRRLVITGATGFIGAALAEAAEIWGYAVYAPSFDLRTIHGECGFSATLHELQPCGVIHCAFPGTNGIGDAAARPATIASDLLEIDLHTLRACALAKVPKLVCLGSVCSYPYGTPQPTREEQLWDGAPEAVNGTYGEAKRMSLALLQAYRREQGLHGIHLLLSNIYGPGDRSDHVIPALIRRMQEAARTESTMVVWGGPAVSRSFLYIDDAVEGILLAFERYDDPAPLNLCMPGRTPMRVLVEELARLLRFNLGVVYDPSKPTGEPSRSYDTVRMRAALDWAPTTTIDEGLRDTVAWMERVG